MESNRFKQLLESKLGEVKPLIFEEEEKSYVVKNDVTLENATSQMKNELKIFKGAKFVKKGNVLVANTKYQFVDSRTGDPTLKGEYGNETYATLTGEVTYICGEGKFTVKTSKYKYFEQYGGLSKNLSAFCKTKSTPSDPNVVKNVVNNAGKLPLKPVNSTAPKTTGHICDQTTGNIKIFKGKSYNYCKNSTDNKIYFKGTQGEPLQKFPNWTEATGAGLESIKSKIFYN